MKYVVLFFIVMPILEMVVLIEVGSVLGSITTVALVLFTAVLGVTLLRKQGLSVFLGFQEKMQSGEIPAQELVSVMLLVIAGAFLLTPGFVTDTIGFIFLVPKSREIIANYLINMGFNKIFGEGFIVESHVFDHEGSVYRESEKPPKTISEGSEIIEGEYKKEE